MGDKKMFVPHVGTTQDWIQLHNDTLTRAESKDSGQLRGQVKFPAPATAFRNRVAASTAGNIGIWAYAADSSVVVVRPGIPPRKWPYFTLLDGSGWENYTSISFCQDPDPTAWPIPDSPLTTASESGIIRIWNIKENATVLFHELHKGYQTFSEWSPRNANIIYGMDVTGRVSSWDVKQNSVTSDVRFEKVRTTCIAVSPHEDEMMAVGTRDGDILILDISGIGAILQKMRHEEQIYSVSWKPNGPWLTVPLLKKHTEPYLVSSIASIKPPSIRVWDRRGKELVSLLPWEIDAKERKLVQTYVPVIWVTHPVTKEIGLVSCGGDGEIVLWSELENPVPEKLNTPTSKYVVFDFLQCGEILWTFTQEPLIVGTNLLTLRADYIIPTYGGICSVQASPQDPSRVAVGGTDSTLRVLKLWTGYPDVHEDQEVPIISSPVKGNITALAWHPRREKIAFGTDEGTLGVFDCKADARYVLMFDRKVQGTIYTIDWGPQSYPEGFKERDEKKAEEERKNEVLWIYACGNRTVFTIHPGRHNNALISVSKIISTTNAVYGRYEGASDIKWSPDLVHLAVGYIDGKIEIYLTPHLRTRCLIRGHTLPIQYLSWRPADFIQETQHVHRWFASASNDATAKIYDLAGLYEPSFTEDPEAKVIQRISSDGILNAHGGLRVISLAWSPHDDNLLLTTSYDRTAIVWNIKDQTRVARYTGHDHRLVAGIFHPSDPHKVITCSDELTTDCSFHIWDYLEYPESPNYVEQRSLESMSGEKVESVKALAAPLPKVMFRPGAQDVPVTINNDTSVPVKLLAPEEKLISKVKRSLTLFSQSSSPVTRNSFLAELEYIIDGKPIPPASELDPTSKEHIAEENSTSKVIDDEIGFLVRALEALNFNNGLPEDPLLHLAVLGSKKDCERMVQVEVDEALKRNDWSSLSSLVGAYAANPKAIIEAAIQNKTVNAAIICSAFKFSKRLYDQALMTYSVQLLEEQKPYEATAFLLLLSKSDEAINLLMNYGLYYDAMALAKTLTFAGIQEVLYKWIQCAKTEDDPGLVAELSKHLKLESKKYIEPDDRALDHLSAFGVNGSSIHSQGTQR